MISIRIFSNETSKGQAATASSPLRGVCLSKMQGSQEKRAKRISDTLSEFCTQITPQFAKSGGRVPGLAGKPAATAHSPGFTIMELMVATAVFSLVLIAAQASFVEIGKLFYKGVSVTQTQNSATHILAELKVAVQTAPANSISPSTSSNGYTYYCMGGNRYTFNLGHELNLSASQTLSAGGNYGILEDSLPGSAACAPPCDPAGTCPAGAIAFNNPQDLLGNKMRVDQFNISQPDSSGQSPNLFQVSVVIVYGDDAVLSNPNDPNTVHCSGGLSTQSFCYVSRLSAYVFQGVSG